LPSGLTPQGLNDLLVEHLFSGEVGHPW